MKLITLLLLAILITLLGGWVFVGVSASIILLVVAAIVIFAVIVNDFSESRIANYIRNTSRIKRLQGIIKTKSDLGYETDIYESEVTYLKKNKFNKSKFLEFHRDS